MKNNKKRSVVNFQKVKMTLFVVFVIILSTGIVALLVSLPKLNFIGGDENSWLGYFGGVVGIIGAYLIFNLQQNHDKKIFKQQSIDNTFFNLLQIFNDLIKDKKKDLESLYSDLVSGKKEMDNEILHRSQNKIILNSKTEIEQELKNIKFITDYGIELDLSILSNWSSVDTIEYLRNWAFDDTGILDWGMNSLNAYFASQTSYWMQLLVQRKSINNDSTKMKEWANIFNVSENQINQDIQKLNKIYDNKSLAGERQNVILKDLDSCRVQLLNEIDQLRTNIREKNLINIDKNYSFDDKKKLVNTIITPSLIDTGNFFRYFYRTIKYLYDNEAYIEADQLKQYLGILRATMDSKTLALIAYNAMYTDEGEKLAILLSKSTFYDSNSIISSDTLLWGNLDVLDIKTEITHFNSTLLNEDIHFKKFNDIFIELFKLK